jgi:uncharacterized membrane protein YhaH (DUF805 family)
MEYMFMPLKRYAEFSGRSRRMEYWMFALFQFVLWAILMILFFGIAGSALLAAGMGNPSALFVVGGTAMIIVAVMCIVWLALVIPALAVGVRRLHDTERSGWWLGGFLLLEVVRGFFAGGALGTVLSLAVVVYAIALLVFLLLDGTQGPNKYGPDPKGRVDERVFA